jgi:hypothetical protein
MYNIYVSPGVLSDGLIIGKCSSEALDLYASDISKSVEKTVTFGLSQSSLSTAGLVLKYFLLDLQVQ